MEKINKKSNFIKSLYLSKIQKCPICLETKIQNIGVTKCGHIFCFKCLTSAVMLSNKCPKCREYLDLSDIYKINNYNKINYISDYRYNYLDKNLGSKLFHLLNLINVKKTEKLIISNKKNITLISYVFSYFNIHYSLNTNFKSIKKGICLFCSDNNLVNLKNILFFSEIIIFETDIINILKIFTPNVFKLNKNITFTRI